MHGLLLIVVGSLLARTANAASIADSLYSNGVRGCTGKLIVEPPFIKGDIE